MNDRRGPTGDYPHGKLNEDDEGGLKLAISTERGTVRLDFGKDIKWFALPPDEALALAAVIAKHAMRLKHRGGPYQ